MAKAFNQKLRNIAIIAHVDHGKTTLVDALFKQAGVFRENQAVDDRLMDNMDLERERGITIAAKNCSVTYSGVKINILDTPGHADFGGEVERALSMVDGVILLVDASEGPLPQTRFVLGKAFEAGHKVIVVINKIDRQDARPDEVLNEVYDLFIDLGADDDQIEFPLYYAIGRDGICQTTLEERGTDMRPLFEAIVNHITPPAYDDAEPFQMLVSDLSYSDYLGRLAVGKVINGSAHTNETLVCINEKNEQVPLRVSKVQTYEGTGMRDVERAEPGDIIILSGIENVMIGDTVCTKEAPKALKRIKIDEPTVSMKFSINTSPLVGKEGKFVQSSRIRERLFKEAMKNVAIRVEETDSPDSFIVKGRGEFQMAIIVETMRREGFELCIGRPEVITKTIDGEFCEPIEHLFIDCDGAFVGVVTEKLSLRKGRLTNLVNNGTGRARLEFSIPSRGLIGYRDEFLSDTKGTGIMNSLFDGYEPHRGEIISRFTGSIVSDRAGKGVAYGLFHLEPRGVLFVRPGEPVYEGMIIGEYNKDNDLNANPCKEKKLTNMRASGKDDAVTLTPVMPMTLEKAIHFIAEDELVEVTPLSVRLRKKILSQQERHTDRSRKLTSK
ncbi:translational GTPase TypA [Geovibrio thiophilus]|uniref:Large ribosomal subunit assembly factor BipA n=1 Tax=Geovibrio thiophilus TaxID=139438 RepID=A0A3R5XVZ7_9BACT|nr:translational GTPase TypA [Geovibrio thiophilus]QAR32450.1 translational GTPase TypA [Geovibrio thiophilus]